MVKVRPQYLLIPDREGKWRVQGAGENAHSILDLGLGAISLSLSFHPSQEGTGVTSTFWASSQTQVPVLHTGTSEAKGTIPSLAHPQLPGAHLSEHTQEALLNTTLDLECKLQGEICAIWNLSNFPINDGVTHGKTWTSRIKV